MPEKMMTRCQTKRLYKVNDKKEWKWVDVAAKDVTPDGEIRCTHCHGAIKLEKGSAGGETHVKHKARVDADNCQNGRGVQGSSGRSSKPVT